MDDPGGVQEDVRQLRGLVDYAAANEFQPWSAGELTEMLRRRGYSENRSSRIGWYKVRPDGVEIFPDHVFDQLKGNAIRRIIHAFDDPGGNRLHLQMFAGPVAPLAAHEKEAVRSLPDENDRGENAAFPDRLFQGEKGALP